MDMLRCTAMGWTMRAWVAGVCAWAAPAAAHAAGEACLRDTECTGAQTCQDGACAAVEPAPASCMADADCDHDAVCSGGFCKLEGVVCRNPAGACWVENGSGTCECADGLGAGWSDGFDPDNPPPQLDDAALAMTCTTALVDNCGTEAPTLPASCTGDVLTQCQAYVDKQEEIAAACGEDGPSSDIGLVGECCDGFDDEGAADVRACVLALAVDGCVLDEADACYGDGGGEPAGGESDQDGNDGAGEKADDDAAQKSGCSIDGAAGAWTLALLVLLPLRRRRRW